MKQSWILAYIGIDMHTLNIKILLVGIVIILSGCARMPPDRNNVQSEKIGTAWGGEIASAVTQVSAERQYSEPEIVKTVHYSDLNQRIKNFSYSIREGDLEFSIRDKDFHSMRIGKEYNNDSGQWNYRIVAKPGDRYQLYFRNYSAYKNYEIVATVDGLDVLNGRPGSLKNSGYILYAGKSLSIQGFRKDDQSEAAFVFSHLDDSYAANSVNGDIENVGIIGFAVFELKGKTLPPCQSQAFPADASNYASPPCKK